MTLKREFGKPNYLSVSRYLRLHTHMCSASSVEWIDTYQGLRMPLVLKVRVQLESNRQPTVVIG